MNEPETQAARLSMDEIMDLITEVARDGDGADKFRALKLLHSMQSVTASLPSPKNDDEIQHYLKIIFPACGKENVDSARRHTFNLKADSMDMEVDEVSGVPLDRRERINKIVTVRDFYNLFPWMKRRGVPKGYPGKSLGLARRTRWLRQRALDISLDEERAIAEEQARNELEEARKKKNAAAL